jgi:hypothetical protein
MRSVSLKGYIRSGFVFFFILATINKTFQTKYHVIILHRLRLNVAMKIGDMRLYTLRIYREMQTKLTLDRYLFVTLNNNCFHLTAQGNVSHSVE